MDAAGVVQVVAAVIFAPDGRYLLAQRPAGKVYAGYWEFPGGKIEPGESPREALGRELHEELGIAVRHAYPWITRHYRYEHATVDLHFYRVTAFDGEPHGRESQALAWQVPERPDVGPMLPANGPILAALRLPHIYAITNAAESGVEQALHDLERGLGQGLRLIQVREPSLAPRELGRFVEAVIARARPVGARVLVNSNVSLALDCGADGVHLKAAQLHLPGDRPPAPLVAASCHDRDELELALARGVDFVVLGPVAPTLSHPGAPVLGFDGLMQSIQGYPVPVYALGGMRVADLEAAWNCGAHGVAMQRGAWL